MRLSLPLPKPLLPTRMIRTCMLFSLCFSSNILSLWPVKMHRNSWVGIESVPHTQFFLVFADTSKAYQLLCLKTSQKGVVALAELWISRFFYVRFWYICSLFIQGWCTLENCRTIKLVEAIFSAIPSCINWLEESVWSNRFCWIYFVIFGRTVICSYHIWFPLILYLETICSFCMISLFL